MKKIVLLLLFFCSAHVHGATHFDRKDFSFYSSEFLKALSCNLREKKMKDANRRYVEILDENSAGLYTSPSENTKQFVSSMLKERNLDHVSIKLVGGSLRDYLAIPLGNDEYAIHLTSENMFQLNNLLDKELLTYQEQEDLNEIEFFLGHEMHHIKKAVLNHHDSALKCSKLRYSIVNAAPLVLWIGLRELEVDSLFKLYGSYFALNIIMYNGWKLLKSGEESECDLNASLNPVILRAGARGLLAHPARESLDRVAQNLYKGLVWKISKNLAYSLATDHPYINKRAKDLLKKAEELDAAQQAAASAA